MPWPRLFIGAFCLGLVVTGALYRGHSVESMDVRTYAQMIRGVADHGLPSWNNGPLDRSPALITPWGVPAHGRVWGIYGAFYPYLVAPVFRIAGLKGVSAATFMMLAPLALVTFLLAKRLVKSEWTAAFAGALTILSTPIMAKALEITPFPLTALLSTTGIYLAVRVIEGGSSAAARTCALSGVAWAAACAAHPLCFPMALASIAVLGVAPSANSDGTLRATIATARTRAAPAFVAFVLALVPVALLNHLRFGSYNPISYGPIPWKGVNPELLKMNAANQVAYSAPVIALVLCLGAALYVFRKKPRAAIAIAVLLLAGALLVPALRTRLVRLGCVAFGYFVDMSGFDFGAPWAYTEAPGGLGRIFGGWVVKSTLQCTPLVLVAPLALRRAQREHRWPLLAILVPCAALYASFAMRANLGTYADAFGWPWVYIRYTFAALPGLVVASMIVVERLAPHVWSLAVVVVAGTGLTIFYALTENDLLLAKRGLLLVAPLVFAVLSLMMAIFTKERSRLATATFAITISLGVGASLGHDLRANVAVKRGLDRYIDDLVRVVPARYAVIGCLGQFDPILTTTATHDVQYADALRIRDLTELRPLLEHWRAEDRPIYVFWLSVPTPPWPDVKVKPTPFPNLYTWEWKTVEEMAPSPSPTP